MKLSEQMQRVGKDLINQFGSTATIVKPSSNTYDVATSKTIIMPGIEVEIKAHLEAYKSEEIKGLIQVGDLKIMVDYETSDIDIAKDKLLFKGTIYNIINAVPIYLQDEIIATTIQARR